MLDFTVVLLSNFNVNITETDKFCFSNQKLNFIHPFRTRIPLRTLGTFILVIVKDKYSHFVYLNIYIK